jgi:hypothetical protein
MKLLAYLLIGSCVVLSCQKSSGDGQVSPNDTTSHDTTHHSNYPFSAKYAGGMHVRTWYDALNMHTWKDTTFDTSYSEKITVDYPDSISLVVHFSYWGHPSEGDPYRSVYLKEDSTKFPKRADGTYHLSGYQNIYYDFRGDTLIIYQDIIDGSQVYSRRVWFNGARDR